MPRPNPPRPIGQEVTLARRIAYERQARGWSYDGLALRMTNAGCPIAGSALHKIEKAHKPRRITVDEFGALAQVFELSMDELLRMPEEVVGEEFRRLTDGAVRSAAALSHAVDDHYAALRSAIDYVIKHRDKLEGTDVARGTIAWLAYAWESLVPDEETELQYQERLADHETGAVLPGGRGLAKPLLYPFDQSPPWEEN